MSEVGGVAFNLFHLPGEPAGVCRAKRLALCPESNRLEFEPPKSLRVGVFQDS